MYQAHTNFNSASGKAAKIRRVLNFLRETFPEKTPELEHYSAISLYVLVSHLLERYAISSGAAEIANWFIQFEIYRRAQRELPEGECDRHVFTYQERTSHSTDSEDSLQWRHDYLLGLLLDRFADLQLKDDQRIFTHDQRLAIYRRDNSLCQVRFTAMEPNANGTIGRLITSRRGRRGGARPSPTVR